MNKDKWTVICRHSSEGDMDFHAVTLALQTEKGCLVRVSSTLGTTAVAETMQLEPFASKWEAFRWNTIEIDGHDMVQILEALSAAASITDHPTVILARTVTGKGVSFMENDNAWHQKAPNDEEYRKALVELEMEVDA